MTLTVGSRSVSHTVFVPEIDQKELFCAETWKEEAAASG